MTMHYSLYLEGQDEPYDSTILRNRAERHRLGQGGLLPGIEVAVKSMLKKEEAEFLIEYEYAFGKLGCPPRVPPEAQVKCSDISSRASHCYMICDFSDLGQDRVVGFCP